MELSEMIISPGRPISSSALLAFSMHSAMLSRSFLVGMTIETKGSSIGGFTRLSLMVL
ncbi:MAG: hypothetical protein ABWK01_01775 [Infirmifilum sp.]